MKPALAITTAFAILAFGFLLGAWAFSHGPQTCASVPNGVVCWQGHVEREWAEQ